jgi:hypothetical protein
MCRVGVDFGGGRYSGTGFAYRYKNLANKMKTRARIYMRYVPIDQLTAQERVVFEDLKKDVSK